MHDGRLLSRFLYILHTNQELRVPKELIRYIPGGQWVQQVGEYGAGATDVNISMVEALLAEGEKLGPGDSKEGVIILQKMVDMTLRNETKLTTNQRLKVYRMLEGLRAIMSEQTVEIDLSDPGEIEEIPKFDTGFQPFDAVTGGFYQGIFLLMGPPGSGKTSLMIALMETLRKNDYEGSLLFLENEIPASMMKGRFSHVFRRTKFKKGDKLICGPWNAHHILAWVKDNPDPNRVILFDGPDVIIGGDASQGTKAFIADEYITMIEMKSYCKAIIASGWPNRKSNQVAHFNDVGDAVEKARYADCIIGINPMANNTLQLLGLKNRFGPPNLDLTFGFDYGTLVWQPGSVTLEADFWAALTEEQEQETQAQTNGRA
jgi:GTPase SAR1 family protein